MIDLEQDSRWANLLALFPKGREIDAFTYGQMLDLHLHDSKERVRILLGNPDGPEDYTLEMRGMKMILHFGSDEDSQKAAASLFPDETFDFVYLSYPKDVPKDYLEKTVNTLQKQYDTVVRKKTVLSAPVQLRADFENHAIRAQAKGIDMPRVLDNARSFAVILNSRAPS